MYTFIHNANFPPPEVHVENVCPSRQEVEEASLVTAPNPHISRVTSPPSAVLRSIMTEAIKDEGEVDEKEARSGKYNKRPAPVPPCSTNEAEDDQDFCTPDSSPVLPKKVREEPQTTERQKDRTPPRETTDRQEENPTENKLEKKKTKKTKTGESHISKMLHFSKIQFPFWNQKGGKHSPIPSETCSLSGISRNDSLVSLSSLQDSYIPLKGCEPEEPQEGSPDVREMSHSPSSRRRNFFLE